MIKRGMGLALSAMILVMAIPFEAAHASVNPKWLVEPIYDAVGDFSEGMARVGLDGSYGFIDKTGEVVIPLIYSGADSFSEGLARVRRDGKPGFIDKAGNEVIPPTEDYDFAGNFCGGMVWVKQGTKYGFIDREGNEAVSAIYDSVSDFSEGLARVRRDGKYGFVDKTGVEVALPIYESARDFSEGLATVRKDGYWGFIDSTGSEVIPLTYDYVLSFSGGLAFVQQGDDCMFINKVDNLVTSAFYSDVQPFSEDLAFAEGCPPYHGFIDTTGALALPLFDSDYDPEAPYDSIIYSNARNFIGGFAAVEKSGQWGFIDKAGVEVVPPIYAYVGDFSEGLSVTRRVSNGVLGFIDGTGKVVIPPIYENARSFSEGFAAVSINGKWGFIKNIYTKEDNTIAIELSQESSEGANGIVIVTFYDKNGVLQAHPLEIPEATTDIKIMAWSDLSIARPIASPIGME